MTEDQQKTEIKKEAEKKLEIVNGFKFLLLGFSLACMVGDSSLVGRIVWIPVVFFTFQSIFRKGGLAVSEIMPVIEWMQDTRAIVITNIFDAEGRAEIELNIGNNEASPPNQYLLHETAIPGEFMVYQLDPRYPDIPEKGMTMKVEAWTLEEAVHRVAKEGMDNLMNLKNIEFEQKFKV